MSGSGLLVLLPLVGVVVGAVANGLYRDWQDKRTRTRERVGLLRIVDAEIYENNRLLQIIKKDPDLTKYPSMSSLSTSAWDQSRTRLADLLSKDQEHLFSLVRHYALIVRIRAALDDPEVLDNSLSRKERRDKIIKTRVTEAKGSGLSMVATLANRALSDGENARRKGEKYIGTLPGYYGADDGGPADVSSQVPGTNPPTTR